MIRKYGKALVAVLYAAVTAGYQLVSGDGRVDQTEMVSIVIAAVTAIGVYLVPLSPTFKSAKTIIGAVLAVLQVLVTAIIGGIEPGEWMLMAIALCSALGIGFAPARTDSPVVGQTTQVQFGLYDD
jgi:hypothetical protein